MKHIRLIAIVCAFALAIVGCPSGHADGNVLTPSSDTQLHPGIKPSSLTVIDFNATWCEPCNSFAPIFHQAAAKYDDVKFYSVDIDTYKETVDAFGIQAVPTIMLISPDGATKTIIGIDAELTDGISNDTSEEEADAIVLANFCKLIDSYAGPRSKPAIPSLALSFSSMYSGILSLGGWSILILVIACALLGAFVWWIRQIDEDFEMWWLHYLLYLVTAPVLALFILGVKPYCHGFVDCACYLLTTLALAIVPIHAGWGVRECGMEDKMYHRNFNRQMGQLLLFPLWILLIGAFWNGLLYPLISLTNSFGTAHYGFWAYILGLVAMSAITFATLWAFIFVIVNLFLRTAGRWPVIFMCCVLWFAVCRMEFNWIYAHFYGLGYVLGLLPWGAIQIGLIAGFINRVKADRCPMCHYFEGYVTDMFDHGVSSHTSTGWESMSDSSISPNHYGAQVRDAQRRVRTTVHTHSWTTEHTCDRCGCTWTMFHSEEVGRDTTELERKWTEYH